MDQKISGIPRNNDLRTDSRVHPPSLTIFRAFLCPRKKHKLRKTLLEVQYQGNCRLINYVKAILNVDKAQITFIHGFQCQTILEEDVGFTDSGLPKRSIPSDRSIEIVYGFRCKKKEETGDSQFRRI